MKTNTFSLLASSFLPVIGFLLLQSATAFGFEVSSDRLSQLLPVVVSQGVPQRMAERAFSYFEANRSRIHNQHYMTLVDLSRHSTEPRKFLINLTDGTVTRMLAAHGRGSDPNHDGYLDRVSNVSGSNQSSVGFYLTAERYQGQHGLSMRLDGLERSNSNARARAIVVHGADYVSPNRSPLGRSFGCPAIEHRLVSGYIRRTENGGLYFIWHPLFNN